MNLRGLLDAYNGSSSCRLDESAAISVLHSPPIIVRYHIRPARDREVESVFGMGIAEGTEHFSFGDEFSLCGVVLVTRVVQGPKLICGPFLGTTVPKVMIASPGSKDQSLPCGASIRLAPSLVLNRSTPKLRRQLYHQPQPSALRSLVPASSTQYLGLFDRTRTPRLPCSFVTSIASFWV